MTEITLPLEELVQKNVVDEVSLPNSVLNRQQSNVFIDLVVDESVLLKRCRVMKVNHNKGEFNRLNLGSIVTEAATATSSPTRRVPTESLIKYDNEKLRSAFDLTSDFLEDNLEKGAARDKILRMFAKRISTDMEMLAIEGDDSLPVGDGQTDENNLLGANNGWKAILNANVPAGQQVDAAGAAASKDLFYEMKRRIPNKYRIEKPNYVWIVGSSIYDKWTYDWTERETAGGDSALSRGVVPGPFGIPMIEAGLMPEDLTYGTAGTDGSQIWLTPLTNLIYIVQREVKIEWDRVPRRDAWEATLHTRCDFQVEEPEMVVIAENVATSGGTDYSI